MENILERNARIGADKKRADFMVKQKIYALRDCGAITVAVILEEEETNV